MEVRAESRAAAVLAWVMPSGALAAAIALAAFSLQSYEFLKRYLDTFAGDGDAEAFTRALFASLVVSSRLAAVALMGVAGALLLARRRIARAFDSFLTNTIGYGAHSI